MKQELNQETLQAVKKRRRRYKIIRGLVLFINFTAVCFLFDYDIWIGGAFFLFSLYSWIFYEQGYSDSIIEDDQEGSVSGGLKRMLKSWIWLAIIIFLMWKCSAENY